MPASIRTWIRSLLQRSVDGNVIEFTWLILLVKVDEEFGASYNFYVTPDPSVDKSSVTFG